MRCAAWRTCCPTYRCCRTVAPNYRHRRSRWRACTSASRPATNSTSCGTSSRSGNSTCATVAPSTASNGNCRCSRHRLSVEALIQAAASGLSVSAVLARPERAASAISFPRHAAPRHRIGGCRSRLLAEARTGVDSARRRGSATTEGGT